MSRTRKIIAAIGVLSFASAIGIGARYTQASAGQDTPAQADAEDVLEVQHIMFASALSAPSEDVTGAATRLPAPVEDVSIRRSVRATPSRPSVPEAPCVIRSRATPEAAASVRLSVSALCLPESRVTVHHNGMLFTARTDEQGRLDIVVPALAERAVFMFTFAGEQMAMALTEVPDIAAYNRVVLQWQGHSGFELHAREFGAEYGADGHVWHGADGGDAALRDGRGGHLVQLGDSATAAPMMAEVYSYPAAMSGDNGQIDLSVEARVTERNCGREIEAQTIELREDRRLSVRSVVLAVPACDAVGDYLVLNNVFEDLKIAAR